MDMFEIGSFADGQCVLESIRDVFGGRFAQWKEDAIRVNVSAKLVFQINDVRGISSCSRGAAIIRNVQLIGAASYYRITRAEEEWDGWCNRFSALLNPIGDFLLFEIW